MTVTAALADRLDAALPQTQCTRCGYADCRHYAQAMARGEAPINQCPPGGAEGIARLATITDVDIEPSSDGTTLEARISLFIHDPQPEKEP